MVVWIASYPRSGSTFFRIALHTLYGYKTYTGFKSGDDIEIDTKRQDLTGHAPLPEDLLSALKSGGDVKEALERLHKSEELYFIKSHCTVGELNDTLYPTLLIVRDPRDTFLSFSHYIINTQRTWPRLKHEYSEVSKNSRSFMAWVRLARNGIKTGAIGIGKAIGLEKTMCLLLLTIIARSSRWTEFYRGWLGRRHATTVLIRFEELIIDPYGTLSSAVGVLGIEARVRSRAVPSFDELKKIHPSFFRQGQSGTWKQKMPEFIKADIESRHGTTLQELGYSD